MALVSWDKVSRDREEGGLGIRDLRMMNEALILKLVWHVASNSDRLWMKVMQVKYYKGGSLWYVTIEPTVSVLWRAI
jgi:hypothetical protein